MRRAAAAVLSLALSAATACATSRPVGGAAHLESGAAVRAAPPVVLATRSMIPTATLDIDPSLSLYDIVGRYWPQVLRPPTLSVARLDPRGDVVGVYIDGNFAGGQDALRGIRAGATYAIQRLTRSEEFTKFGRSHEGGALIVTFR